MADPVETYLRDLRDIRSTGAAVKETSHYSPLANPFNEIGKTLKPKFRCNRRLFGAVPFSILGRLISDRLYFRLNPFDVGAVMTFPVIVHPSDGQFEAALVGEPDLRVLASTREEALAALELAIVKRLDQGELVALEVRRRGLAGLFGKYRDDPTLREICETAYQERDADVPE